MFVYKEPDYMAKLGKAEEEDYITGDRMATFMLYLSEVMGSLYGEGLVWGGGRANPGVRVLASRQV